MTEQEIKDGAPKGDTHYRFFYNMISYYKISNNIYRFDDGWLYFDVKKSKDYYDLKPL